MVDINPIKNSLQRSLSQEEQRELAEDLLDGLKEVCKECGDKFDSEFGKDQHVRMVHE